MNLHHMSAYNAKQNIRSRWLISYLDGDEPGAKGVLLDELGEGWVITRTQWVCTTADHVFKEI